MSVRRLVPAHVEGVARPDILVDRINDLERRRTRSLLITTTIGDFTEYSTPGVRTDWVAWLAPRNAAAAFAEGSIGIFPQMLSDDEIRVSHSGAGVAYSFTLFYQPPEPSA